MGDCQGKAFQAGGPAGRGGGWPCAGHTSLSLVSAWKEGTIAASCHRLGSEFSKVAPVGAEHGQVTLMTPAVCFGSPGAHAWPVGGGGLLDGARPGGGQRGQKGRTSPPTARRPGLLSRRPRAAGGQARVSGRWAAGARRCPERDPDLWAAHGGQISPDDREKIATDSDFPTGGLRGGSGHGGDSPVPPVGAWRWELWATGGRGQWSQGLGSPSRGRWV